MSYVNIGKTDDPAYRYKMPRVTGKVEGRGNGIKTVITNVIDLGLALHRNPDEVCKFMGCELGAQTIWLPDQERAIVNGAHKDDVLQDLVHLYVDKFVLCPTCNYPETSYKYKLKRDEIYHNCKACGAKDPLKDEGHKLVKYILGKEKQRQKAENSKGKKGKKDRKKNAGGSVSPVAAMSKDEGKKAIKKAKKEAKKEKKRLKKEKKKEKKRAKKAKKNKKQNDSGSNSEDSDASKAETVEDEQWASEGADPVKHNSTIETSSPGEAMTLAAKDLTSFIATGAETRQVIDKLGTLQVNYKLQLVDRCGILFSGAFGKCQGAKEFLLTFQRFKTFFRQLIVGNEKELLAAFERHFTRADHVDQLAVIPLLLQLFNNEELVGDTLLQQWHSAKGPWLDRYGIVIATELQVVKSKADAFIETLGDSDESDSSSSDSD